MWTIKFQMMNFKEKIEELMSIPNNYMKENRKTVQHRKVKKEKKIHLLRRQILNKQVTQIKLNNLI